MPPKKRTASAQAGRAAKKPKQSGTSQQQAASSSGSTSSAVWCMQCSRASTATCRSAHECVDVLTARLEAERRLSAAQATLSALQALESKQGVRLTATAKLRGDEGEQEEGRIGITLTVGTLSEAERAAVLDLFHRLDVYAEGPFMVHSCNTELAGLRARLPPRGVCTTLKAGAILVRGEATSEDRDDADDSSQSEDVGEDEDAEGRWCDDGVRIYYNNTVKPHQARGAKVLGYITTNVKLLHQAKPGGSYYLPGWGERWDSGMAMELEDVKFV